MLAELAYSTTQYAAQPAVATMREQDRGFMPDRAGALCARTGAQPDSAG
jgi:hypothetical protein